MDNLGDGVWRLKESKQENFVMTQLLHKSFFDEELTRIREKAIEKGHQVMTKKELFEPFGGEL